MEMACERIPLRYGVRSDHLLCSVLFISSCIGTLEIIRILILGLNGQNIKVCRSVCARKVSLNVFTQRHIVFFFCRVLASFATEGQYKDRQPQHEDTTFQREVITLFAII